MPKLAAGAERFLGLPEQAWADAGKPLLGCSIGNYEPLATRVDPAHVGGLEALAPETRAEVIEFAATAERVLRDVYRPDGLNFGVNLGRAAGAGIEDHVHVHAVPRWAGDTNFMTVTSESRVLPEDLAASWKKVRGRF